ncbi:MAG: diaminopimelate epimerase, partial [Pseudomonadota bacterium]
MQYAFTKMHGLGNDFVVIQAAADVEPPGTAEVRALADRRLGIGFDQLLWVTPATTVDTAARYRVLNADGGEVEQCGNGVRCIARFLADAGAGERMTLESPAGPVEARIEPGGNVTVGMGVPVTEPAGVPFDPMGAAGPPYRIAVAGAAIDAYVVGFGNPHAVVLVDDVASAPVETIGAALQAHEQFPERVNVGFLALAGDGSGRLRVYERGVGETRACGTGACAATVAAALAG